MKYIKIENCNLVNGDGARVILWVSGCTHQCKNCHNKETWDFNQGKDFNEETMNEIFKLLDNPFISGLTISGGDPLHPENAFEVIKISKEVKERYPNKNIWIWTGYLIEQIVKDDRKNILSYIDVLIDGPFIESKPTTKKYRGSDNQRRYLIKNNEYTLID
ncbi:MAG: anaerobic ribonucleoside-triphosphate reductase activating protein [Mycoplasma sp.]